MLVNYSDFTRFNCGSILALQLAFYHIYLNKGLRDIAFSKGGATITGEKQLSSPVVIGDIDKNNLYLNCKHI